MRVALYYTPDAGHPLVRAAAEWLGRSPFSARGYPAAGSGVASGPEDLIASPRRYGFHATLKAPFELAEGTTLEQLAEALASFCRTRVAPSLGPLQIADLGEFIALVPDGPRAELEALAAEVVREFDAFRAPLGDAELARRRSGGLTARQDEHLRRWGYPHVLEDFRFHMTLPGGSRKTAAPMSSLCCMSGSTLSSTQRPRWTA
jgi:hypothetical protein